MRCRCLCIFCALLAAAVAAILLLSPSVSHAQSADKPISFMQHVAPILRENCFSCHDAKKRKGKLDMSTFERLMKGGDKGEPVVAGKPEESNLFTFSSGADEPRMPPKDAGDLLPIDKLAILERWIKEGAKFDGPNPNADIALELRKLWRPAPPPATYEAKGLTRAMVFTPDNQRLVVGGLHELLVWNIATGKLEKRIHTRAERAGAILWLPDGKTLVVAGGRPGQEGDVRLYNLDAPNPKVEGEVKIYNGVDASAGAMVRELVQVDDEILCLALSPDGKKLAAGGCDRVIRIWDVSQNFKLEQSIENHADWVFGLAFAPDNKHLMTCSRDKTAKVWDIAAKESVLTFPGHENSVWSVAVKPDGKEGISAGDDKNLRFWTTTGDGKQVRIAAGHQAGVLKVLSHPTKPILISSSADKTVRLWNRDNGSNTHTLQGHTDWVYALAISPDGNLIASGAWNGEIRVWKIADGAVVKAFQGSPGARTAAK